MTCSHDHIVRAAVLACLLLGTATMADAQFDSGSNGSFGELSVPSGEVVVLPLPPDGVFHATTVSVVGTLRFTPNAQNTPVRILAQGDVTINGTIDINGQANNGATPGAGGPGGFQGGAAGDAGGGQPAGWGMGPGGGAPGGSCCSDTSFGRGAFGCPLPSPRPTDGVGYGNPVLLDLIGGSGGGGSTTGTAGGGGGGAILVASNTRITFNGLIGAEGGFSGAGPGSGGAIRLVAPVISGSGDLNVRPGNWTSGGGFRGGGGRSRVDALNRSGAAFDIYEACSHSTGAVLLLSAPGLGQLRIISAAGEAIAEASTSAVFVQLAPGSSPTQNVTVRARGYTGEVPIAVVLTPERGDRVTVERVITVTGDPTDLVVPVTFPINQPTRVDVFTR